MIKFNHTEVSLFVERQLLPLNIRQLKDFQAKDIMINKAKKDMRKSFLPSKTYSKMKAYNR